MTVTFVSHEECNARYDSAMDSVHRLLDKVNELTADRDEWKTQHENLLSVRQQDLLTLSEKIAFLESREVCAAAHDRVEPCGYCQRDALIAALREIEECYDGRDLVEQRMLVIAQRALDIECSDFRALCPHGFVLSENVCGPCSEGRPNSPQSKRGTDANS